MRTKDIKELYQIKLHTFPLYTPIPTRYVYRGFFSQIPAYFLSDILSLSYILPVKQYHVSPINTSQSIPPVSGGGENNARQGILWVETIPQIC